MSHIKVLREKKAKSKLLTFKFISEYIEKTQRIMKIIKTLYVIITFGFCID